MLDDFAGVHEIAGHLGVSRQRVHQLTRAEGFPAPIARLCAGAIWWSEDVLEWQAAMRPTSATPGTSPSPIPSVPARDPDHPRDDPWDADALRYLLATVEGAHWSRRELMGCLRGNRHSSSRRPHRTRLAAALARQYGVTVRVEPGGSTRRLFRSDRGAPSPYPVSAVQRRRWLSGRR